MTIDWHCTFCKEHQISHITLPPESTEFKIECNKCKRISYFKIQSVRYDLCSSPVEGEFQLYGSNAIGWS